MGAAPRVTVRPAARDDDLDALNAGDSGWLGATLTWQLFTTASDQPSAMVVGELEGRPVGYAQAVGAGIMDGHRGMGSVYVQPAARHRGVGTALWEVVLGVCTPERVPGIRLHIDAGDTTSQEIALAHGCTLGGLHIESELDLTRSAEIEAVVARTDPGEIVIAPLPADADEDAWREVAALHDRLLQDAPDMASGSDPMPYPILRTFLPDPWQVMLARHDGRPVGVTCVAVLDAAAGALNTHLTAVDAAYRGRGLATALKARHALALGGQGWRRIRTQNLEGNDAILASNRTLGFAQVAGRYDLLYDYPDAVQ